MRESDTCSQEKTFHVLTSDAVSSEDAERILSFARDADPKARILTLLDAVSDQPRRCIYITDRGTGVTKADLRPVLEMSSVQAWLIVICGLHTVRTRAGFPALRSAWEQGVGSLPASITILSDDEHCQQALQDWMRQQLSLEPHTEKICLLAAPRPRVGRTTLREQLERQPVFQNSGWQFEERLTSDEDYPALRDAAARVVFLGSEIGDFQIPAFPDGLRKSFFFLGKCDVQPSYYQHVQSTRNTIRQVLRASGWDIGQANQNRIWIGSALYSRLLAQLRTQSLTLPQLLAGGQFVMWDDFLLPSLRQDYTEDAVLTFLRDCDCIPQLTDALFPKRTGTALSLRTEHLRR